MSNYLLGMIAGAVTYKGIRDSWPLLRTVPRSVAAIFRGDPGEAIAIFAAGVLAARGVNEGRPLR